MILSDQDIRKNIKSKDIFIKPYNPRLIQPASIDLRLGDKFLVFNCHECAIIDVKEKNKNLMREININNNKSFIIHPNEFALGMTYETVGVSDKMVGRLEGKSSLGRLGLIIHATAGYLDPGNCLNLTLELHNIGNLPIKLYYKMPIAQMSFTPLSSPCKIPYGDKRLNSKYYGAKVTQASKMYENF
tara:strand:- start:428 stop:988 length:561 start_codon:yes stop_codon:yes gene_type:complete